MIVNEQKERPQKWSAWQDLMASHYLRRKTKAIKEYFGGNMNEAHRNLIFSPESIGKGKL